jgi:hypothetical protein
MISTMVDGPARRLRLVVAAAGYGKTTALRRMFPGPAVGWHRDGDVGALIGGGLAELAAGLSQIVVDDLPPMSDRVEQVFLDAVAGLPETVSVAVSSRWPVGSATSEWLTRLAPRRSSSHASILRSARSASGRIWQQVAQPRRGRGHAGVGPTPRRDLAIP